MTKVEYKDTEIAVKKKLGQNFLTDRNITRKIVTGSEVGALDNILEIGPGFGALTREIAVVCPVFTVIEKDRKLAEFIRTEYPMLKLIEGDFLDIDLEPLAKEKPLRILGNIPYSITTGLLATMFTRDLNLGLEVKRTGFYQSISLLEVTSVSV